MVLCVGRTYGISWCIAGGLVRTPEEASDSKSDCDWEVKGWLIKTTADARRIIDDWMFVSPEACFLMNDVKVSPPVSFPSCLR
jgi:hypothetical protein